MNIDMARQKLFAELTEKAVATSRQIISMLDTEFEALTGNNPTFLETVVNDKKQYLISIGQIMAEQESLLSSMNLPHDKTGVEALYANLPANHPWRDSWKKLQKLAKMLADKNLRNGITATQHTDHTRKALDILTGHHSDQPTYQYGGKTESYRQSNSLAYA